MPTLTVPIVYNQQDSRWSQILLGFNTQLPYNFYNFACLITCLAMVAQYYGKDWNPVKINDDLKKMGAGKGFAFGSGNYVYGGFNRLFGDIKETRISTPSELTNEQIGQIKSSIDSGHPVMVQIDVNPKTVQADMHFVLIIGYNPQDENDFTIADPIGGVIRSLKYYLGYFRPNARRTIEQYTILAGNRPVNTQMVYVGKDQWELMRTNHDKWHGIVHYFDASIDPNATTFENIQHIVAGIKSRTTDMENKANDLSGKLIISNAETENRKDQVSRLERLVLENEKNYKARLDAINSTIQDPEKLRGQYEGEILKLKDALNEEAKAKGKALSDLATCQANQSNLAVNSGLLKKVLDILTKIFK